MSGVAYSVAGGVATLSMDMVATRNALRAELVNGLGDGLAAAQDDPAVRVVVLTNTGPAFCAGADLSGRASQEVARYGLAEILGGIQDCPKPVVAKIAGHCMGGGVGLAAACDISVADDRVQFGFTEVRLGLAPAIISVVCLPKLRRADALQMFLTGERVPASRAAEVGLINAAVSAVSLDATVDAQVGQLLAGGPGALAAAKGMIFSVPGMDREDAFARMTELSESLFASEEGAEGTASFREKRRAAWLP